MSAHLRVPGLGLTHFSLPVNATESSSFASSKPGTPRVCSFHGVLHVSSDHRRSSGYWELTPVLQFQTGRCPMDR
jgi:hypothetical protein